MAVSTKRSRTKSARKSNFLPEVIQSFIAKRIIELFALFIIATGLFIVLSLYSFQTSDPSLNTSASEGVEAVKNWMGLAGAYFSDIFAQSLGYSSFALGFIIMLWGGRLFRKNPLESFGLRLIALLFGTLFLSICL